eukprot:18327-Heterococcus_DN1.PRE.7
MEPAGSRAAVHSRLNTASIYSAVTSTPRLNNKYAAAVEGQQTLVKTSARLEQQHQYSKRRCTGSSSIVPIAAVLRVVTTLPPCSSSTNAAVA